MVRNKNTGEKTTSTKSARRHAAAVDAEIRKPTPVNRKRTDRTFAHLHKTSTRYDRRQG